jgi:DNA-binding transcriptional MerR regulator
MRIGELAGHAGVTTKAIRYYESIGVLPEPPRLDNGYRDYPPDTVDVLRFLSDAQAAGLALDEIRHVVTLKARGLSTCEHVASMVEKKLADVEHRIAQLEATRRELQAVLERAAELDPSDCTDPTRCQTIETSHRH